MLLWWSLSIVTVIPPLRSVFDQSTPPFVHVFIFWCWNLCAVCKCSFLWWAMRRSCLHKRWKLVTSQSTCGINCIFVFFLWRAKFDREQRVSRPSKGFYLLYSVLLTVFDNRRIVWHKEYDAFIMKYSVKPLISWPGKVPFRKKIISLQSGVILFVFLSRFFPGSCTK